MLVHIVAGHLLSLLYNSPLCGYSTIYIFMLLLIDISIISNAGLLCIMIFPFSAVSCVQFFATPWTAAHQAGLSQTPGACSNSCPLGWWCHPTISSSVVPLSSCLQSFPASRSFPMSQFFIIRWPKHWSFSISPSNEYSGLWSNILASIIGEKWTCFCHYTL